MQRPRGATLAALALTAVGLVPLANSLQCAAERANQPTGRVARPVDAFSLVSPNVCDRR